MNPTCIFHEPEDVYHSRSKSGDCLSSHMLKTFQQMPYKYYAMISGLYQEPDKAEYAIGTAAHKLILEGKEAFDEAYTVACDAPVNEKTGKPYGADTKKYQEWLALQDKNVISIEDFEEIAVMNKSVIDHPVAPEILRPGGVPVRRLFALFKPNGIDHDVENPESGLSEFPEILRMRTLQKGYGHRRIDLTVRNNGGFAVDFKNLCFRHFFDSFLYQGTSINTFLTEIPFILV